MNNQDELLNKKVTGTLNALLQMTPKERETLPTKNFGEDYNKILSMVLELHPDLKAVLPPPVLIEQNQYGVKVTKAHFVEIQAYLEQIKNFIS